MGKVQITLTNRRFNTAMAPKLRLSEKLMFSTVKIKSTNKNGKIQLGTGFFFSKEHAKVIVTNKHVIENSEKGELSMTIGINNEPVLDVGIQIKFERFSDLWEIHPDNKTDLAVMPLIQAVQKCREQKRLPFYVDIQDDTIVDYSQWRHFIPVEDILMVGYPYGLWDRANNLPFFMKGITSSHPGINYNGQEEFVLNVPIYPGSSGSPIFLVNEEFYKKSRDYEDGRDKVRLLGIAYKHLYYTKEGKTISEIPQERKTIKWDVMLELGIAIRSTKLNDFDPIFKSEPSRWEL